MVSKRLRRHSAALLSVCFLALPATGCSAGQAAPKALTGDGEVNIVYTDEALALDYAVPVMTPSIKVNQTGYLPKSDKRALLTGAHLPDTFSVIDMESGETVYEGEVTERTTETAAADFTRVTREGTYYLKADVVGVSYAFTIGEDVYAQVLKRTQKQFYLNRCGMSLTEQYAGDGAHSVCHTTAGVLTDENGKTMDVTGGWHLDGRLNRNVTEGCRALEQMLLALEMNAEAFDDETGIPESDNDIPDILDEAAYEARWLLKMQDEASGGVHEAALTDGSDESNPMLSGVEVMPVTMEATGSFAAALAHFAYAYRSYDASLATQCVQASDKAFRLYRTAIETAQDVKGFHAACELYRATGDRRYAEAIDTYLKDLTFDAKVTEEEDLFLAAVAYLSTSGEVDKDACARMMEALMEQARAIAAKAGASPYRVAERTGTEDDAGTGAEDAAEDAAGVLLRMRTLAVANHILYNHEYQTIILDHAHYLMGRNERAVNLVTEETEYSYETAHLTGIRTQPLQAAQLVFLLSAIQGKV